MITGGVVVMPNVRAKRAPTAGTPSPGWMKMYRVPPARAWWPAVGAPLERGVRPHSRLRLWSHSLLPLDPAFASMVTAINLPKVRPAAPVNTGRPSDPRNDPTQRPRVNAHLMNATALLVMSSYSETVLDLTSRTSGVARKPSGDHL